MIRRHFRAQQFLATNFTSCELLSDLGLFIIGQTADHWACGGKNRWQMPESRSRHDKARNDLVAHAQKDSRVIAVVA